MTEIRTVPSVPITDDFKRLSAICYDIGYLSALCNSDIADEMADGIVNYITELFNAKKETIPTTSVNDLVYRPNNPYPYGKEITTGTPLPPQGVTVTCKKGSDTE